MGRNKTRRQQREAEDLDFLGGSASMQSAQVVSHPDANESDDENPQVMQPNAIGFAAVCSSHSCLAGICNSSCYQLLQPDLGTENEAEDDEEVVEQQKKTSKKKVREA